MVADCSLIENPPLPSGISKTHDPDDAQMDIDGNNEAIDLADFFMFNVMLLVLLPPDLSVKGKTFVLFDYIISVQIGHASIRHLGHLWDAFLIRALLFPVIFISFYAAILNLVIQIATIDCITAVN